VAGEVVLKAARSSLGTEDLSVFQLQHQGARLVGWLVSERVPLPQLGELRSGSQSQCSSRFFKQYLRAGLRPEY
jgi:hypothetical protein